MIATASAPVFVQALRPVREREPLTPAEVAVTELLLQGLSNKEIASARGKAEATIKHHVSEVLWKHGVPSRARLIALSR